MHLPNFNFKVKVIAMPVIPIFSILLNPLLAKPSDFSYRFFGFIPFDLMGSYYSDNVIGREFIDKIESDFLARVGVRLRFKQGSFTTSLEYQSLNQFNLRELFFSYSWDNIILEVGKRPLALLGVGQFYNINSVSEDIYFLNEDKQEYSPTFWGLNLGFVKGQHGINWINHVAADFEVGEVPEFASSSISYSLENAVGFLVANCTYWYAFKNENQLFSFSLESSFDTTLPGWLIYLGASGKITIAKQTELNPEGIIGTSYQPQQNIGLIAEYFYRLGNSFLGLGWNVSLLNYRLYFINRVVLNFDNLELTIPFIIGYNYHEFLAQEIRINYIRTQNNLDFYDIVNMTFRTTVRF